MNQDSFGEKKSILLETDVFSHISCQKFLLNILYWGISSQTMKKIYFMLFAKLSHLNYVYLQFLLVIFSLSHWNKRLFFSFICKKSFGVTFLVTVTQYASQLTQNSLQTAGTPQCEGLTFEVLRLHSWGYWRQAIIL